MWRHRKSHIGVIRVHIYNTFGVHHIVHPRVGRAHHDRYHQEHQAEHQDRYQLSVRYHQLVLFRKYTPTALNANKSVNPTSHCIPNKSMARNNSAISVLAPIAAEGASELPSEDNIVLQGFNSIRQLGANFQIMLAGMTQGFSILGIDPVYLIIFTSMLLIAFAVVMLNVLRGRTL